MQPKRLQVVTFLIGFGLVTLLVTFLIKGYLTLLAFGIVLAILCNPVYRRVLRYVKNKEAIASLVTVIVVLLVVMVPIWLFGQLFFNEIYNAYTDFTSQNGAITRDVIIERLPEKLQSYAFQFSDDVTGYLTRYTTNIFNGISHALSNVLSFFFAFFLLLFTLYYLLRDQKRVANLLMQLSPISDAQERLLFDRVSASIRGVIFGTFLVALVQGVVATIGFLIVGLPNAFLWGLSTCFAAVIPTIGTTIIIVPAILFLFFTGHTLAAGVLLVWGAIAVGMIDNFLSPKLVGSKAKLHPVLVMFGVIGGLQFFGFLGFLLGPIVMAVFVALIEMYRTDFQKYLEQ